MSLTVEQLFDLVAPIHIYHHADIALAKRADRALEKLKHYKNDELVKEYFGQDIKTLDTPHIDMVDPEVFWRVYDQLFITIVQADFPYFEVSYDKYGARCFQYNGVKYLTGDDAGCFPFYLDSETLQKRLNELRYEESE